MDATADTAVDTMYVVVGSACFFWWNVCAFHDKEQAQRHADNATRRARAIKRELEKVKHDHNLTVQLKRTLVNEYDPTHHGVRIDKVKYTVALLMVLPRSEEGEDGRDREEGAVRVSRSPAE